MSLELWSTVASVGTFVVIAATAIAAVIQLRHMRASNQITILNDLRKATEDEQFREAIEFIYTLPSRVQSSEFRAKLQGVRLPRDVYPIGLVGRLYETLGSYVNRGMLDADLVCDLWAPVVFGHWEDMADAIVVMRRTRGPELFENFEYLACISKRYLDRSVSVYPKGLPRIAPEDKWAAEDLCGRVTPTQ
ncbi:MAG: hypothetical protein JO219_00020 [Candidatus Eremiobacteraeota bacterium]|nr:hypothetical protein [Candidatus Eremiobacteraeota bacterium]MBV8366121.1 hypothetical protein [Candidatus Eremiobacteraeota bacterium]